MDRASSLLVVGLARNIEHTLYSEVSRIERIMTRFYSRVDFFIVESDSCDKTVELLETLSSKKSNIYFESLGNLEKSLPSRIDRLRYCRNRYISAYRRASEEYSEVLVVDFDIRNTKFSVDSMQNILRFNSNWSGVFANQTGRYFDIFALRAEEWCTTDCFSEATDLVSSGLSREKAKEVAIWQKMKRIRVESMPIPVDSAFGGMALYRSWVFDEFDYSTASTPIGEHESEHVALNYKIKLSGGELFILPGFTNFGWNPHNLASFRIVRKLDRITPGENLAFFRSLAKSLLR